MKDISAVSVDDSNKTNLPSPDAPVSSGVNGANGEVRIHNQFGLHARPAAQLVKLAQQYEAEIRLKTANGEADAKSILDILSLAAGPGVKISIQANGSDAQDALEAVVGFFEQ